MATNQPSIQKTSIPFYRDERILRVIAQIVSAVLIIGFIIWALFNFFRAAEARNMTLSFGFLKEAAGFPISNPPIDYEPSMTFGRAFMVGVINTVLVSILGVIFATIFGTLIALARLSSNWLLNKIALAYIEFHRNIPLLVLLFIWYFVVFGQLPQVNESIALPGPIYINKRGFYFGWARLTEDGLIFSIAVIVGVLAAIIAFFVLRRLPREYGQINLLYSNQPGIINYHSVNRLVCLGRKSFRVGHSYSRWFQLSGRIAFHPRVRRPFSGSDDLYRCFHCGGCTLRYSGS